MAMRLIRNLLLPLLALGVVATAVAADEYPPTGWETDFQRALDRASAENKYIMVDFTGSDWCGWCKRLDREVFSKSAFKDFAKDNLVLLFIDSPSGIKLSDAQVAQNDKLGSFFQVQGYPTIVLLRPDSTPALLTGYREGGAEAYVRHLKEAMDAEDKVAPAQRQQWISSIEETFGVNVAAADSAAEPESASSPVEDAPKLQKKNS